MLSAFTAEFLYAVVALFVIIDPVGVAIIFATLTSHDDRVRRAAIAKRAALISFLVLLVFGLAGEKLLRLLGISIPALQIAGGALLFLSAKDMVTAKGELRASDEERTAASNSTEDISVFPLAIPLIAGPGGMTTMVLLHAKAGGLASAAAANALALAAMIAATLVAMLAARRIAKLMGTTGASVVGRVLGILVAALAAQFIIEGLQTALHLGG